ncbi:hemolysin family protein [Tepidimonas sp.]|uniref:hemolysin family protein n=1 Tax=Tepidimonas sp. TaxID=2002775 RepID=UPI002FE208C0
MDIVLIAFLTLLSGMFSMTEIAVVSSRRARIEAQAAEGDHAAHAVLRLQDNPTLFFSTIQMGNTTIALLNGIVGEGAFGDGLTAHFLALGLPEGVAHALGTATVVVGVTYVTIVFGELVAKRIGQTAPEAIARVMAPPLLVLATVARPFVHLLAASTNFTLRLLRIPLQPPRHVTEEEIHASLRDGAASGVIEREEHRLVRNVLALDDRQLASLMVPRADIDWLDAEQPLSWALHTARQRGHSWYPVCRGALDQVRGIISLRQLMALEEAGGREHDWARDALPATFVPETLSGLELLEQFRARAMRMVLVVDEYGEVHGLLTPLDLLEAITGELSAEAPEDAWATPLPDGGWRVDGAMPAHELKARLDIEALPDEDKERYHTVAGLMLLAAGRLLTEGNRVAIGRWSFEVSRTEGHRIAEVVIRPLPPEALSDDGPAATA